MNPNHQQQMMGVLTPHTTDSMDLLLDDDLTEDTLLMEKATFLLQETDRGDNSSSSSSGKDKSLETTCHTSKKTKSTKKAMKKSVQFASASALTQLNYLEPRDSEELIEILYYTEDEMQMFLHQLQCDVANYDSLDSSCPLTESDTFTPRGLERRTKKGQTQRSRWRKTCRNAVMDEQDRQWAILPMDEPTDAKRIAFVSLEVTHKAKQLARQLAIQDEREILGDLIQLNDSITSISLSCSGSNDDSFIKTNSAPALNTRVRKANRKGHSVRFPTKGQIVHQVFEYEHASTDQEKEALWHPYIQLDAAKLRFASQIALLENRGEPTSATSIIIAEQETADEEEEQCLRGLESRTVKAEAAFAELQTQVAKTLRFQHVYDEASLAKQCQKLSAKSRKQARSLGLMDQRAVKAYLYQQEKRPLTKTPSKKFMTRVPKTKAPSPTKRSPPSSPPTMDKKKNMATGTDGPSAHGTVKRTSSVINKDNEEEEIHASELIQKQEDMSDDCMMPITKLLRHTSESTATTMDSTLASSSSSLLASSSSLFSSTRVPSPEQHLKATVRRSLPNLSPPSLQKANLDDSPPRRHSSVFLYPPLDEEGEDEEHEEAVIPSSVLISIPDKYFGKEAAVIVEGSDEDEDAVLDTLDWSSMEEDDDNDGSERLSGIIDRLWEKRRSQAQVKVQPAGMLPEQQQCEAITALSF